MTTRIEEDAEAQTKDAPYESKETGGEEEGIEEFMVKIMSDLKTVREKITQAMFTKEEEETVHEKVSPVKPWNLRKRRAACKEPVAIEERIMNQLPPSRVMEGETTKEKPRFSVKPTRKETEEDFVAVFGHRPPRRPKKRPRNFQKKLDVSLRLILFLD